MKLTDEQLQEIADKGAEAAHNWLKTKQEMGCNFLAVGKGDEETFKDEAPARFAYTNTVIDLALSKMAEGEERLVLASLFVGAHGADALADTVNRLHRQAMAALRAQMQGEIDECWAKQEATVKEWQAEIAHRDQWKERAEKAEAEVQEKAQARYESLLAKKLEWLEKCIAGDVEAFAKMPHAELIDALKSVRLQLPAACHAVINASVDRLSQLAKQQAPADREAFEKVLADNFAFCEMNQDYIGQREAVEALWQAALAHKPQPWIPCSERMPTREDGDVNGRLLVFHKHSEHAQPRIRRWNECGVADIWMPIPPLPTAPTAEKVPTPPDSQWNWIDPEEVKRRMTMPAPPVGDDETDLPESLKFEAIWKKIQEPNLVTFTPEGKINPPPYGSWHRSDWTPEMLPDGWRPVMRGEWPEKGDEIIASEWVIDTHTETGLSPCHQDHYHQRTRRPLPPAPEKEKEPEWVPLTRDDVKLGDIISHDLGDSEGLVVAKNTVSLLFVSFGGQETKDYDALMTGGYKLNGKPCKKIKQP